MLPTVLMILQSRKPAAVLEGVGAAEQRRMLRRQRICS